MQWGSIEDVRRFIRLTKHNLFTLAEILIEVGYRFADADGPIQLTNVVDVKQVDEIEARYGCCRWSAGTCLTRISPASSIKSHTRSSCGGDQRGG